jgi:hypothetical protein
MRYETGQQPSQKTQQMPRNSGDNGRSKHQ